MEFIYNFNALPFFNKRDLMLKDYLVKRMELEIFELLQSQNRMWQMVQIEAPCLIPKELINQNYTHEDVWEQQSINHLPLVLKPETTPSSYVYMEHLLKSQQTLPPLCVWQVSKSFRREQDQPTKHCRFKEFYQQEFQCLYTKDTKNNYQDSLIIPLANVFFDVIALPTRVILSERLPSYSLKTIDIEVFNEDKWMEVCSVSLRNDFTYKPMIKSTERECLVLEIAFGLERLIYNINQRQKVFKDLKVQSLIA